MVSTILSRRKENIAELRAYLCIEATDAKGAPQSDTLIASSPRELIANERRILAAYDNAIAPMSGRHEKFDFLSAQSEWLQGIVDGLPDAAPAGA